jgi:hypothetical protein
MGHVEEFICASQLALIASYKEVLVFVWITVE